MNKSVIYIVGATVLVGGAYLFLKNKKAKDLAKLDEIGGATLGGATLGGATLGGATLGGTTPSGATLGGTTPFLSTTSDGVSPSDANLNLANATVLVGQRAKLKEIINTTCLRTKPIISSFGTPTIDLDYTKCINQQTIAKKQLVELDAKLAKLGYKLDAIGQLVKI